jgi:hypothetical protein
MIYNEAKFKVGDKVLVIDISRTIHAGVTIGDVGYVTDDSSAPYVKFDHIEEVKSFAQQRLKLVTGEESELEKLLLWNRVSK